MVHPALSHALRFPLLSSSSRRLTTAVVHPSAALTASLSNLFPPSSPTSVRESRLEALRTALLNGGTPSSVWALYANFLSYFSYDSLPVELHQEVLRQCSPPAKSLRLSAAKRLLEGKKFEIPHRYEGRFQTIISNIRAMGSIPSLEDYHFVLEQFAAVGHHVGSIQVYKELVHLGITPIPKTYGLCLQAIAHRVTLPVFKVYRPRLVLQTRKSLEALLSDMRKFQIPLTASNIDLIIRVFKETTDETGFEALIRWAYGIDLSNPDRPPLEYLEGHSSESPPTPPLPFSTHALNTIIDTLGRFGNISKLVQAFEVLTKPLPQANQHLFSSFDDDDDFGVAVNAPSVPSFTLPHAPPNTTTFNLLLRHIGRAGHTTLARHYLMQAIMLDRHVHQNLHYKIWLRLPLHKIIAPHFGINRQMLLSVFGHTNRNKNLGLMRWLSTKLPRIIRTKANDLAYFTKTRDFIRAREQSKDLASASTPTPIPTPKATSTAFPSQEFYALASSMAEIKKSSTVSLDLRKLGTAFDVNVNDESMPQPNPTKMFDIDLHIKILERDLAETTAFAEVLDSVLGRTTQRVKERLGRRVWANKDIYLSSRNQRVLVSREHWRAWVHFRARREPTQRQYSTLNINPFNDTSDIVSDNARSLFPS